MNWSSAPTPTENRSSSFLDPADHRVVRARIPDLRAVHEHLQDQVPVRVPEHRARLELERPDHRQLDRLGARVERAREVVAVFDRPITALSPATID